MQTPNTPDDTSRWDDLVGALSQKPVPSPPAPQPPPVDQSAWEKSVEQAKVSDSLGTVHDLGLPSANVLNDPATRIAYESSMKAAREAYLSGTDPTYGAVHFNARGDAGRRNWLPKGMKPPGKPLKTQSGPYNNSYTKGDTPFSAAWLNTYEP